MRKIINIYWYTYISIYIVIYIRSIFLFDAHTRTHTPPPDRSIDQIRDVIDFCHEQPEIRSWLDFFDDPSEDGPVTLAEDRADGEADALKEDDKDIIRRQVCVCGRVFPCRTT